MACRWTPPSLPRKTRCRGGLFIHGWGGSQQFDLSRAKGIAALGCVCLTFDLRGHAATQTQQREVTREDNLRDAVAAYDRLALHPSLDSGSIAVVGSSYGGYLVALLSTLRAVRWLVPHVSALYRDDEWLVPKNQLNRETLRAYRSVYVSPEENRALKACTAFTGDVLLVEAEHDSYIPHSTIMSYRSAFRRSHSLAHRIIDSADHALTEKPAQRAYTSILVNWVTEVVMGARMGEGRVRPGGAYPYETWTLLQESGQVCVYGCLHRGVELLRIAALLARAIAAAFASTERHVIINTRSGKVTITMPASLCR